MILRFKSKDGMFRLNAEATDQFAVLLPQLMSKISAESADLVTISKDSSAGEPLSTLLDRTIANLNLKHGDMLNVNYERKAPLAAQPVQATTPIDAATAGVAAVSVSGIPQTINFTSSDTSVPIASTKPKQLSVDDELDKIEGLIPRQKSYMCRHGAKGMCEYCSPLAPWDKDYQKEKGYKHLSYHAYVKSIDEQKNNKHNSTSYMAPLEEVNYNSKILPNGVREGPAVITLQQQKFRMVDHVEISNFAIMNKFIDVWRQTGVQRIGYMYGRYEPYEEVPLGIKAVVEAIYEPPQAGEVDGLTLLPWDDEENVERVASALGLMRVGVVFTDLTDLGLRDATVLCKRHKDSYFLSCLEILMAARNQIAHPNVSKHSNTSIFLSKFVTCVISGGLKGEIEPRSYQVSLDAEALVKADIITGTTQPSMLYVNDSNGKRFVPDLYFLKINEYGLEIKTNAKPTFPVEFLLVSLSDSFPKEMKSKFSLNFTIENRDFMGDLQDLKSAYRFLNNNDDGKKLVDFHFIVYLLKMDILGKEEQELLFKFISTGEYEDYLRLVELPGWMTLVTILEQSL